jgi:hypothetical protein
MTTVEPTEIMISDAILHLLDPDDGGFSPSQRALPNLPGSKIASFLAGHIAQSLSDSQIKGARFVAYGLDATPGILQRLVSGSDFVNDSQALARAAYDIMSADKRIKPPGSLAVLRYVAASEPEVPRVAALKLDKGGRYRWIPRTDAAGANYWDLEESLDAAPGPGERLHKAVFVGAIDTTELAGLRPATVAAEETETADEHSAANPDVGETEGPASEAGVSVPTRAPHQFLVLDRQVAGTADWWLTKFLLAANAFTDDDCAARWYKAALTGKSLIQDRLSADQRTALDLAIRSGITSASVNVNNWIDVLDIPDELRTEVRAQITAHLPDNEFAISERVRAKYSKATWVGDNGLRITIDAAYSEQVKPVRVDGGWEVTITTSRWDQIK